MDNDPTASQAMISDKLRSTYEINVSQSTISRVIKKMNYTIKAITYVPEERNSATTINQQGL